MKKMSMFFMLLIILTGCRHTPFDRQSIIDWVDFVKWDGIEYDGIYNGVLANEKYIGDKLGEVKFKVADNVTNYNYKIRNGDAAFHEKGTEIFGIEGLEHVIALKASQEINGYRLYSSRNKSELKLDFQNMPLKEVNHIEIYQPYSDNGRKEVSIIKSTNEIDQFLQILTNSEEIQNFDSDTSKGDPLYYEMVFYTNEPVAYKYNMQFDGTTYFWYPIEIAILSKEIQAFLN